MHRIQSHEKMLFGASGELQGFSGLLNWFKPFFELGETIYTLTLKKRSLSDSPLS